MSSVKLIEQISRILVDPEGYTEEHLQSLAREYGEACKRLNAATAEALEYFEDGFYCEAYRLIEEKGVVEEYLRLSFEGRKDWREICRLMQYELQEDLSDDACWRLEEFHMRYAEKKELFALNRKLALSNAPISERLDVLYRLAEAFPENPRWASTLEELETARESEIQEFLKTVRPENANAATFQKIMDELTSPLRQKPAKPELVARIRQLFAREFDEDRKRELEELAQNWYDAYQEKEEDDALYFLKLYRAFSEKYASKLDYYFNELPEETQLKLADALKYAEKIETRDRKKDAVDETAFNLEQLVDNRAKVDEVRSALDQLENALNSYGQTSHKEQERAERYLNDVARQKTRKTGLFCVAIVFVVGAIIYAVGIGVAAQKKNQEITKFRSDVERYIAVYENASNTETKRLNAIKTLENLAEESRRKFPDQDADVEDARNMAEETIAKEKNRIFQFQQLVDAVNEQLYKGASDLNTVKQLEKLSLTLEEKTQYADLAKKARSSYKRRQENLSAAFQKRIETIDAKFQKIKDDKTLLASDRVDNLKKLALEVNGLSNEPTPPSSEVMLRALDSAIQGALRISQEELTRETFVKNVGYEDVYLSKLEQSGINVPDIVSVKDTRDALEKVKQWNWFTKDNESKIQSNDFETLKELQSLLQDVDADLNSFPEYQNVKDYVDSFVSAYNQPFDAFVKNLRETLKSYDKQMWMLYHRGDYFYLDRELTWDETIPEEKRVERANCQVSNLPDDTLEIEIDFVNKEEDKQTEAFHYRLYHRVNSAALKNEIKDRAAWNKFAQETLEMLLDAQEDELDPVLKYVLLEKVLTALVADPFFKEKLEEWLTTLQKDKRYSDELDYFKQDDDYIELRPNARDVLREYDVNKLNDAMASDHSPSFALAPYRWIGFVDKKDGFDELVLGKNADLGAQKAELFAFDPLKKEFVKAGFYDGESMISVPETIKRFAPIFVK